MQIETSASAKHVSASIHWKSIFPISKGKHCSFSLTNVTGSHWLPMIYLPMTLTCVSVCERTYKKISKQHVVDKNVFACQNASTGHLMTRNSTYFWKWNFFFPKKYVLRQQISNNNNQCNSSFLFFETEKFHFYYEIIKLKSTEYQFFIEHVSFELIMIIIPRIYHEQRTISRYLILYQHEIYVTKNHITLPDTPKRNITAKQIPRICLVTNLRSFNSFSTRSKWRRCELCNFVLHSKNHHVSEKTSFISKIFNLNKWENRSKCIPTTDVIRGFDRHLIN